MKCEICIEKSLSRVTCVFAIEDVHKMCHQNRFVNPKGELSVVLYTYVHGIVFLNVTFILYLHIRAVS